MSINIVNHDFYFHSLYGVLKFSIRTSSSNADEFINDLFQLYRVQFSINIINTIPIKNEDVFRKELSAFVKKYREKLPIINQLNTFYEKVLPEGEESILIPFKTTDKKFDRWIYFSLQSRKEGKSVAEIEKEFSRKYGTLLNRYSIDIFDGTSKTTVGEINKSNRVCRFCKGSFPDVTFKKKAHAISEALGNSLLFCNEECDSCNESFTAIEQDIITYFDVYRAFLSIKGKEGVPTITGKNYVLANSEGIQINLLDVIKRPDYFEKGLRLVSREKVSVQNIYKVLSKFALSLLDYKYISEFEDTIKWIRGEMEYEELPLIAVHTSTKEYLKNPCMTIYKRDVFATNTPRIVCEFTCINITFFFILPFSKKDKKFFIDKVEYDKYWEYFKPITKKMKWNQEDFSNSTKKDFVVKMKFSLPKELKQKIKKYQ